MTIDLRSRAAIVGIGCSAFTRSSPQSGLALMSVAMKAALADAGIKRDEVDGITTHMGTPVGDDYDQMAHVLGLNIRHGTQYVTHGRFITPALQNAAVAVATGLADIVACVHAFKANTIMKEGAVGDEAAGARGADHDLPPTVGATSNVGDESREGGGPHGEQPAFGVTTMATGAALSIRRYMEMYGFGDDVLMPVVLAARAHAARNPRALLRDQPLTAKDYLAQPFLIDPIRPADELILGDGAVVVLVTTTERARLQPKPPVYIRGMQGMRSGREEFLFAPRGLGTMQQRVGPDVAEVSPQQVYQMAGIAPSDINAFYTYDAYSPMVLFALERFGHCAPGEAARFAANGEIGPGGRLPVNTSGGMLAETALCGWNSITEIVRQLRGEADSTQLPDAGLLQWGGLAGSSIIFGREP